MVQFGNSGGNLMSEEQVFNFYHGLLECMNVCWDTGKNLAHPHMLSSVT